MTNDIILIVDAAETNTTYSCSNSIQVCAHFNLRGMVLTHVKNRKSSPMLIYMYIEDLF